MHPISVRLLLASAFVAAGTLAAQGPVIGIIDFYGLRHASEPKVRAALGVKEGGPLPKSKLDAEEALANVPGVVRAQLEAVCCEDGKAILYVGLEEKGAAHFDFREAPSEAVLLPEEIHEAYYLFLGALNQAVKESQLDEDLTQGHSLMAHPDSRKAQERFLPLAAGYLDVIRDVLRNSLDDEHRAIAAYVIGYAPDKKAVLDDLLYALRDPDDTVRNNAMRSLTAIEVYSRLKPSLGIRIPATWMVEMLNSIVWADRAKAAVNLVNLTEDRDPALLDQIRARSLDAVIDMARWKHLPHALAGYILLGRILGMEEKEIQDAWASPGRLSLIEKAGAAGAPPR